MNGKDKRLRDVLSAYGADAGRWPVADRQDLADPAATPDTAYREALAIDRLLAQASAPEVPPGAEHRLMMKARGRSPVPGRAVPRWTVAVPLAASLLLGIYLGADGSAESWLPPLETAVVDDGDSDLSGVGEAETYAEENVS